MNSLQYSASAHDNDSVFDLHCTSKKNDYSSVPISDSWVRKKDEGKSSGTGTASDKTSRKRPGAPDASVTKRGGQKESIQKQSLEIWPQDSASSVRRRRKSAPTKASIKKASGKSKVTSSPAQKRDISLSTSNPAVSSGCIKHPAISVGRILTQVYSSLPAMGGSGVSVVSSNTAFGSGIFPVFASVTNGVSTLASASTNVAGAPAVSANSSQTNGVPPGGGITIQKKKNNSLVARIMPYNNAMVSMEDLKSGKKVLQLDPRTYSDTVKKIQKKLNRVMDFNLKKWKYIRENGYYTKETANAVEAFRKMYYKKHDLKRFFAFNYSSGAVFGTNSANKIFNEDKPDDGNREYSQRYPRDQSSMNSIHKKAIDFDNFRRRAESSRLKKFDPRGIKSPEQLKLAKFFFNYYGNTYVKDGHVFKLKEHTESFHRMVSGRIASVISVKKVDSVDLGDESDYAQQVLENYYQNFWGGMKQGGNIALEAGFSPSGSLRIEGIFRNGGIQIEKRYEQFGGLDKVSENQLSNDFNVNPITGNLNHSAVDFSFKGGSGFYPITLARSYSSQNSSSGAFGLGWNSPGGGEIYRSLENGYLAIFDEKGVFRKFILDTSRTPWNPGPYPDQNIYLHGNVKEEIGRCYYQFVSLAYGNRLKSFNMTSQLAWKNYFKDYLTKKNGSQHFIVIKTIDGKTIIYQEYRLSNDIARYYRRFEVNSSGGVIEFSYKDSKIIAISSFFARDESSSRKTINFKYNGDRIEYVNYMGKDIVQYVYEGNLLSKVVRRGQVISEYQYNKPFNGRNLLTHFIRGKYVLKVDYYDCVDDIEKGNLAAINQSCLLHRTDYDAYNIYNARMYKSIEGSPPYYMGMKHIHKHSHSLNEELSKKLNPDGTVDSCKKLHDFWLEERVCKVRSKIMQYENESSTTMSYEYDILRGNYKIKSHDLLVYDIYCDSFFNIRKLIRSQSGHTSVEMEYDAVGQLTLFKDENDLSTTYEYKETLLKKVIYPDNSGYEHILDTKRRITATHYFTASTRYKTIQFKYDDNNSLLDKTIFSVTSNGAGEYVKKLVHWEKFSYDTKNFLSERYNSQGMHIKYLNYSAQGLPKKVMKRVSSGYRVESLQYNDYGLWVTKSEKSLNSDLFEQYGYRHIVRTYDNQSRLETEKRGYGTLEFKMDETDALTKTIKYIHPGNNLISSIDYGEGRIIRYEYANPYMKKSSEENGLGGKKNFTYGNHGLLSSINESVKGNKEFSYIYTAGVFKIQRVIDEENISTDYKYDKAGRLIQKGISKSDTNPLQSKYDSFLKSSLVDDPFLDASYLLYNPEIGLNYKGLLSHGSHYLWEYTHDQLGRVVKEIKPDGRRMDFSFDPSGNVTDTSYSHPKHNNGLPYLKNVKQYDVMGRTLSESIIHLVGKKVDNTQSITFSYLILGTDLKSDQMPAPIKWDLVNNSDATASFPMENLIVAESHSVSPVFATAVIKSKRVSFYSPANKKYVDIEHCSATLFSVENSILGKAGWFKNSVSESQIDVRKISEYTYNHFGSIQIKKEFNYLPGTSVKERDTKYTYSKMGHLASVTSPENSRISYQYDRFGNKIREELAGMYVFRYQYNCINKLLEKSIEVTNGVISLEKYGYEINGRLQRKEDSRGFKIRYEYYGNDKLKMVNFPDSTSEVYTYNNMGKLVSKKGRIGNWTFNYYGNCNQLLMSQTGTQDAVSITQYYLYDARELQTASFSGNSGMYQLRRYDSAGRMVEEKTPSGTGSGNLLKTREYTHDGKCIKITEYTGSGILIFHNRYDKYGRIIQVDIPGIKLNNISSESTLSTYFQFDSSGNLLSKTDEAGNLFQYAYDNDNRKTSETRPDGSTITYQYDQAGNVSLKKLVKNTKVDDRVISYSRYWHYEYNWQGNIIRQYRRTTQATPNNSIPYTSFEYDFNGNLIKKIGPEVQVNQVNVRPVWQYTYDECNRLNSVTDPQGKTIKQYTYNGDDTRETETDGNNKTTTYEYNALGKVVSINVPSEPNQPDRITQFEYDDDGRLIKKIAPSGAETVYEYNRRGLVKREEIKSKVDGSLNSSLIIKRTYTRNGKLASIAYGKDQKPATFTYNKRGKLIKTVSPGGIWKKTQYDRRSNPVRVLYPDEDGNSLNINMEYDTMGRIISRTSPFKAGENPQTVTSFDYNPDGSVRFKAQYRTGNSDTSSILPFHYEYNPDGTVAAVYGPKTLWPNEADFNVFKTAFLMRCGLSRAYSAAYNVTDKAKYNRITFSYNNDGSLQSRTMPDNTVWNYIYDSVGRLNKQISPDGRQTITEYDAVGNVVKQSVVGDNGKIYAISYAYTSRNEIRTVRDPLGRETHFTYDADGNLSRMTDHRGYVSRFEYDGLRRLTKTVYPQSSDNAGNNDAPDYFAEIRTYVKGFLHTITSPFGDKRTYFYNRDGQPVAITHSFLYQESSESATTSFKYYSNGTLKSVTDPLKNTVTIAEYSKLGQIKKRLLPMGKEERFRYDSFGRMTGRTDVFGNTYAIEYDLLNRPVKMSNPDNTSRSIIYDSMNRVKSMVDENGQEWGRGYTDDGLLKWQKDPMGLTSHMAYDKRGNLISSYRTQGNTDTQYGLTRYSYDAVGRLVMTTAADSTTQRIVYDDVKGKQTVYDQLNNATSIFKDGLGRVVRIVDPIGNKQLFEYEKHTRLVRKYTDAGEQVWTRTYDGLGRLSKEFGPRFPARAMTTYTYDKLNRVTEVRDRMENVSRIKYDALGRVERTTNPMGHYTEYKYRTADLAHLNAGKGLQLTVKDAEGNDKIYRRGFRGLLRQVEDEDGNRTSYGYDPVGRMTNVTDAMNRTSRMQYDSAGRLVRKSSAMGFATQYSYDAAGRLSRVTDPRIRKVNGRDVPLTLTLSYDAMDRVLKKSWSNGETTQYSYDPRGLLSTAVNGHSNYSYRYDKLGRMVQKNLHHRFKSIKYEYNARGQRSAVIGFDGKRTSYSYHDEGMLKTVTSDGVGTFTYNYRDDNRLKERINPNNTKTSFDYDASGRTTMVQNTGLKGALFSRFSYSYDKVGNRTKLKEENRYDGSRTTSFEYDDLYRLKEVEYGNGTEERFQYDRVGNRIFARKTDGSYIRYTYDADNRLILSQSSKTGETKYRYDNAGNMTRKTTRNAQHFYTYNAENRMTGYKKRHFTGGSWRQTIAAYKYSAEGNRIEKKVDGQIRRYIYDGIHIMYTMSQSGSVLSRFVYGNRTDERLARIKPSTLSTVEYYHTDAQGSTTELSDMVGNRTSRYRYTAFGETRIKQAGDSDNQFLYAGRQWDGESGLYYNRFRMYDAGDGRFTGKDSYPGDISNPMSLHRYLYGLNNPTRYTDPLGLFNQDDEEYIAPDTDPSPPSNPDYGNVGAVEDLSGTGNNGPPGFDVIGAMEGQELEYLNERVDTVLDNWHQRWADSGKHFNKDSYMASTWNRTQAMEEVFKNDWGDGNNGLEKKQAPITASNDPTMDKTPKPEKDNRDPNRRRVNPWMLNKQYTKNVGYINDWVKKQQQQQAASLRNRMISEEQKRIKPLLEERKKLMNEKVNHPHEYSANLKKIKEIDQKIAGTYKEKKLTGFSLAAKIMADHWPQRGDGNSVWARSGRLYAQMYTPKPLKIAPKGEYKQYMRYYHATANNFWEGLTWIFREAFFVVLYNPSVALTNTTMNVIDGRRVNVGEMLFGLAGMAGTASFASAGLKAVARRGGFKAIAASTFTRQYMRMRPGLLKMRDGLLNTRLGQVAARNWYKYRTRISLSKNGTIHISSKGNWSIRGVGRRGFLKSPSLFPYRSGVFDTIVFAKGSIAGYTPVPPTASYFMWENRGMVAIMTISSPAGEKILEALVGGRD